MYCPSYPFRHSPFVQHPTGKHGRSGHLLYDMPATSARGSGPVRTSLDSNDVIYTPKKGPFSKSTLHIAIASLSTYLLNPTQKLSRDFPLRPFSIAFDPFVHSH